MQVSIPDHPALALLPEFPTADQIEAFGHLVQRLEGTHGVLDLGTHHVHADGLYGRGVVIKAGTFLVGLPHKAGHLNVCVGDVVVWTAAGRVRLTGANILPADAGAARVGFALEDTTWFTVHRNDTGSKDVRVIEDALVEHPERLITRRHPLADFVRLPEAERIAIGERVADAATRSQQATLARWAQAAQRYHELEAA